MDWWACFPLMSLPRFATESCRLGAQEARPVWKQLAAVPPTLAPPQHGPTRLPEPPAWRAKPGEAWQLVAFPQARPDEPGWFGFPRS